MSDLRNNQYVNLSLYHLQLTRYLQYFSLNRILVVTLSDIAHYRLETLSTIFAFIAVDPDFESSTFNLVENRSRDLRRRPNALANLVRRIPRHRSILGRMPKHLRWLCQRMITSPIRKPNVSDQLRERLVERIQPDTDKLRSSLGRAFSHWTL